MLSKKSAEINCCAAAMADYLAELSIKISTTTESS